MDLFGDLPEPDHSKRQSTSLQHQPHNLSAKTLVLDEKRAEKRKSQDESAKDNIQTAEKQQKKVQHENNMQTTFAFTLKGYVADRQGEREDMQDAHVIMDDYLPFVPGLHNSIHRLALYAVFDGHGGARASRVIPLQVTIMGLSLPHLVDMQLFVVSDVDGAPGDVTQVEKEIKKVFIEAFKKTDEDFLKEATKNKPSWKDGTTAVVVLAINDTLYIANLGDSKAILCRCKESDGKCVGIPLTNDHSPSLYEERMRVQKAGGLVRDGRVMGVLEVARSIGDGPYKNHGVTCVPDIKRCQLTDTDRYLMIACDGLWKSYSVDESIQFVNKILEDTSVAASGRKTTEDVKFELVCSKLANAAVLRLSGDNVTVILVSVRKKHEDSIHS